MAEHTFQKAYVFFNKTIFNDSLPDAVITTQRKKGAYGYYQPKRFISTNDENSKLAEIAMNPDHFGRNTEVILSTLVHEMVHLWQYEHGKPSRNGYHNKQWATKMEEIGLVPSTTGEPDGKKTGQKVTHYIEGQGLFFNKVSEFIRSGYKIDWTSFLIKPKKAKKTKIKYSCPQCNLNVWAKNDIQVSCLRCNEILEPEL